MRIECPGCNAAYDVPAERLAPGRQTRCARCSILWTPIALPPQPEPDLPSENTHEQPVAGIAESPVFEQPPDASPVSDPAPPPHSQPEPLPADDPLLKPTLRSRTRHAPLAAAWFLSIALLAGLTWGALSQRNAIMHAWPPSTRAYAIIGLTAG